MSQVPVWTTEEFEKKRKLGERVGELRKWGVVKKIVDEE